MTARRGDEGDGVGEGGVGVRVRRNGSGVTPSQAFNAHTLVNVALGDDETLTRDIPDLEAVMAGQKPPPAGATKESSKVY